MSQRRKQFYEFGPFRLDSSEQLLLRGGETVPLKHKEFETLLLLVENSGRLVEKEKFFREVWPDAAVEDGSLTVNISNLRKALGRDEGGRQYIETVPRRGYRFVANVRVLDGNSRVVSRASATNGDHAPVEGEPEAAWSAVVGQSQVDDAAPAQVTSHINGSAVAARPLATAGAAEGVSSELPKAPIRRGRRIIIAAAALAVALAACFFAFRGRIGSHAGAQDRTLAVLPFDNLKPDSESDFLRCSLASAVTAKLGNIRALVVRPSAFVCYKYRNQQADPLKAAEELKVSTLLTGSYLKEGDNLYVNAQLIDVPANRVLWQDTLSLKYERLSDVQERVSRRIINELGLKLTPAEANRFTRDGPGDPLAYEYYMRGVDFYYAEDYLPAIDALKKSLALDPNYPRAWAQLGSAYSVYGSLNFGGREFYSKAQDAYEHALKLDPGLTEAKAFLADLLVDTNRFEQATTLMREALQTDPDNGLARWELAYAYRFGGMLDESIAEGERSRESDPTLELASAPFSAYLYSGRYDEFITRMRDADNSGLLLFYRGLARYYMKDRERAAADFRRSHELDPSLLASNVGMALLDGQEGRNDEGLKILREAESRVEANGVIDGEGVYKIAQGYAALGDRPSALRMLRRSIDGGFVCYPYFISDPLLESIRHEPEFADLLEAARQRHEAYKKEFFDRASTP